MSRRNYLIRLAFCGSAYHGFQVQQNALSVCQLLQDAMQAVLGQRVPVKGCSRTDAGVHARDYCVSFFADTPLSMEKMPLAINAGLPADIRVYSAQLVPEDFHARYNAAEKEYCYVFLNSSVADAFTPHLSYRVAGALDAPAMHAAAGHLVGQQDFRSFMTGDAGGMDTVRTVTKAEVRQKGPYLVFTVAADGFLYNMVRIMAGTVLLAGRGRLPPGGVPGILAARDRATAGDTMAAQGLYLNRVTYPGIAPVPSPQGPFVEDLFQ